MKTSAGLPVCERCYLESIERICKGYTFTAQGGTCTYRVPPLPRVMAARVRRAAREYLAAHGPGTDTANHPHHCAAA